MNRIVCCIAAVLVLGGLGVQPLHAAEGLYLGAGAGVAGIKDNVNTDTFDENDAAYKAFIGWRFKAAPILDFAIEATYTDFGKPSQTLSGQRVENKLHGTSFAGLLMFPLGPIDLYGKLGALNWSQDRTVGGTTTSNSGTDSFYGLGGGLNLGPFGLRAEYERFQIKDVDRLDLFSLSALIQF